MRDKIRLLCAAALSFGVLSCASSPNQNAGSTTYTETPVSFQSDGDVGEAGWLNVSYSERLLLSPGDSINYNVMQTKGFVRFGLRVASDRPLEISKIGKHVYLYGEGGNNAQLLLGDGLDVTGLASLQKGDVISVSYSNGALHYNINGENVFREVVECTETCSVTPFTSVLRQNTLPKITFNRN